MTTKKEDGRVSWSSIAELPVIGTTFETGETMSIIVEVQLADGSIQRAHTWQISDDIEIAWILDDDEPEDVTHRVVQWRHCTEQQAA